MNTTVSYGNLKHFGEILLYISYKFRAYSFILGIIIILGSLTAVVIMWFIDYQNFSLNRVPLLERVKLILIVDVVALFLLILLPSYILPIFLKQMGLKQIIGGMKEARSLEEAFYFASYGWMNWFYYIIVTAGIVMVAWSIISIVYYTTIEGEYGLDRAKFLLIRNLLGFVLITAGVIGFAALSNEIKGILPIKGFFLLPP